MAIWVRSIMDKDRKEQEVPCIEEATLKRILGVHWLVFSLGECIVPAYDVFYLSSDGQGRCNALILVNLNTGEWSP